MSESDAVHGGTGINKSIQEGLQVGAVAGLLALPVGAITGLIRSRPRPGVFAFATAVQWFVLGSSFWASRSQILSTRKLPNQPFSSRDRTIASTFAGGIAGGLTGHLMRGHSSIIPGILTFSLLGFGAQSLYSELDEQKTRLLDSNPPQGKPLWHRIADMKWSPMKVLTDEEYRELLREKLVKAEAEIAILDEDIEKLRRREGFVDGMKRDQEE
ncbi:MAG: hypothetical protein MMC33_004902 [Icmadophila ericetorum]|nr:hypothetical protein [Icmadophila ericetorum]